MKDSIGMLLKMVTLELEKQANRLLAPYDLTYTQFKMLMLLFQKPTSLIRQVDMEKYFAMSNPTVAGILKNLEKKGLLQRLVNPADGRSRILVVTGKAMDIRQDLFRLSDAFDQHFLERISEEEQSNVIFLLRKMLDNPEPVCADAGCADAVDPVVFYPRHPDEEKVHLLDRMRMPPIDQKAPIGIRLLWEALDRNLETALPVYEDRSLEITGVVLESGKDILDFPMLRLSDREGGACYAQCSFRADDRVDQIPVGEKVIIRGNYMAMCNWYGVFMRNCSLTEA